MQAKRWSSLLIFSVFVFSILSFGAFQQDKFITYTVNPQKQNLKFYWKDESGQVIENFLTLKNFVESKNEKLVFAMNGGMFMKGYSPQGLYIENYKTLVPIDTISGSGNFYLKPNGIFCIDTNNRPLICRTEAFPKSDSIRFATQSGPMLLMDGKIHPAFKEGSTNLNIRNGVGILPSGEIALVMSKEKINFYDFANYFKTLGCKNALYLDGFVSRTYLPEQNWIQTDGNFGVMIAVTQP